MQKIKELISLFKKYNRKYSSLTYGRLDEDWVYYKIFITDKFQVDVFESFVICLFYKKEEV